MPKRFIAIWFRHLTTDWQTLRHPALREIPFVLAAPDRGRKIIRATNAKAEAQGIFPGLAVADARSILPALEVIDERPGLEEKLLRALGRWCIRYTPVAAVDFPDGLLLEITGCAHLWGGEKPFLKEIITKLRSSGYDIRAAMADTIGAAWAISRYGQKTALIGPGEQAQALLELPAAALRLNADILDKLNKLGLTRIGRFISLPRSVLRRRLGESVLRRLDQALGKEEEIIHSLQVPEPYQERLTAPEPIVTATGIEIALNRLLYALCERLQKEGKGIRKAVFSCFRMDGKTEKIEIGTHIASHNASHLFTLFELKIETIEPASGIEVFLLEAPAVEAITSLQESLWGGSGCLDDRRIVELMDRLSGKFGNERIHRYLPSEHHWPERSAKPARSLQEKPATIWREDHPRPIQLLANPIPVQVTAPIPDYPPMLFRYKDIIHKIKKADGPERIEREWWLEPGLHRDYYIVEVENGNRYWLFRSGHYLDQDQQWFIHGFFA